MRCSSRFCLLALLALAACSGGGSPYGGSKGPVGVKLGKPYTVMGQYYEPKYDPDYEEEGIASWYGPGFHGRMTASGEQFDSSEMTCAHRTLPMPSMVRVTRLDNGKSVVARVNDRGPFAKNRILDMSEATADALGVKGHGTANVRVEYLEDETSDYIANLGIARPAWMTPGRGTPPSTLETQYAKMEVRQASSVDSVQLGDTVSAAPVMDVAITASDLPTPTMEPLPQASAPTPVSAPVAVTPSANASYAAAAPAIATPPIFQASYTPVAPATPAAKVADAAMTGSYLVQTASFKSLTNAEAHAEKLSQIGSTRVEDSIVRGETFYRVVIGPVASHTDAQQMLDHARSLGFTDARILVQ